MRQRLRKISQVLAIGAQLFGIKPNVVRIAKHLLEKQARLIDAMGARQALDIPEGARREASFTPPKTFQAFIVSIPGRERINPPGRAQWPPEPKATAHRSG